MVCGDWADRNQVPASDNTTSGSIDPERFRRLYSTSLEGAWCAGCTLPVAHAIRLDLMGATSGAIIFAITVDDLSMPGVEPGTPIMISAHRVEEGLVSRAFGATPYTFLIPPTTLPLGTRYTVWATGDPNPFRQWTRYVEDGCTYVIAGDAVCTLLGVE